MPSGVSCTSDVISNFFQAPNDWSGIPHRTERRLWSKKHIYKYGLNTQSVKAPDDVSLFWNHELLYCLVFFSEIEIVILLKSSDFRVALRHIASSSSPEQ
ncbi:hypothetical protein J6590_018733 [Homalodisca vitripennis]|nr:hypothetical protein J6590_018733 [Homalodisca vitripennis]